MAGSLILLHGASSSGKSTLGRALQPALPQPFLFFSLDLFLFGPVLPRDGDGQLRNWADIRSQVLNGFYRCLPALLEAGNHLVAELILENAEQARQLEDVLRGYDVYRVGLLCPPEELERREQARGDRRLGDARRDAATVHTFMTYDLHLNCTAPLEENVARVVTGWQGR